MVQADDDHHTVRIRKRPWWLWLLSLPWLGLIVFFVQTAVASAHEFERQAATVSWGVVFVLLVLGLLFWFRHGRYSIDDD